MLSRVWIILGLALLAFGQSNADTPHVTTAAAWVHSVYSNQYSSGETIKTNASSLPGNVSFTCTTKGQLSTSIWRGPIVITDTKPVRVRMKDTKRVKLFINNEKQKTVRWRYSDKFPAIRPLDVTTQAAIYNAVVRGDKVTMIFRKELPFTLILPKPNEAFAKFGKDCGFAPII